MWIIQTIIVYSLVILLLYMTVTCMYWSIFLSPKGMDILHLGLVSPIDFSLNVLLYIKNKPIRENKTDLSFVFNGVETALEAFCCESRHLIRNVFSYNENINLERNELITALKHLSLALFSSVDEKTKPYCNTLVNTTRVPRIVLCRWQDHRPRKPLIIINYQPAVFLSQNTSKN